MRVATISMMVMRFLAAIALNGFRQCVARARIRVPSLPDCASFSTSAGIFSAPREQRRGMQDFRCRIRQLRRFFKGNRLDAEAFGRIFGSVVFHAVDVRPYLDASGIKSGADGWRREVRSAATNRSHDAFAVGEDDPPSPERCPCSAESELSSRAGHLSRQIADRARELVVCNDAVARVQVNGIHAKSSERSSNNLAVDALSERKNVVGGA